MESIIKFTSKPATISTPKGQKNFYSLETSRLLIRKLQKSDIDAYYQLFMDDPELFYLTGSPFFEKSEMEQIFTFWENEKEKFWYDLIDKQNQSLIGDFNLVRYASFDEGEAEIR